MRLPILGATLAGIVIAPSALAGSQSGSRIDPHPRAVSQVEGEGTDAARRVMRQFGECVARGRRRVAEEALALPLMSDEQDMRLRRSIGGSDPCLVVNGATLQFSTPLLIGAMAEYLVRARFTRADVAAISSLTGERQSAIGLAPRTGYEDAVICTVRADPTGVDALVRSVPASSDERAAFSRIMPSLGPCLPVGQTITFTRASLRALLAAGLHRTLTAMASADDPAAIETVEPD